MNLDDTYKDLNERALAIAEAQEYLRALPPEVTALEGEVNFYFKTLTFHVATHADALTLIKHLPHPPDNPKWRRQVTETSATYWRYHSNNLKTEIVAASLPPTCKVVYEEITAPAIPERTIRIPKVVCGDHDDD